MKRAVFLALAMIGAFFALVGIFCTMSGYPVAGFFLFAIGATNWAKFSS
jgi:hypothetical protein